MSEKVSREHIADELEKLVKNSNSQQTLELTTLQKLISGVFVTGCLWVGATVQDTSIKVARMEATVEQATAHRYSSQDAARDLETVNQRFISVDGRLRYLEGRHQ